MAFTPDGSFGTANSTTAGTTLALTPTTTLEVGKLAILVVSCDNEGQEIANNEAGHFHDTVSAVTDTGGNVWRCLGSNSGTRATNAGASVAIFGSIITTQLTTSSTITVTFRVSLTAKAATGYEFTTSSSSINVESLWRSYANPGDPEAITLDDLPSREYLFIRAIGTETNNTSFTATTNFTPFTNATANTGTLASSMSADGEFRILTGTSATSDPTKTSADNCSIFVALSEAPPSGPVVVHGNILLHSTGGVTSPWPQPHEIGDIGVWICETQGGEAATLATANGLAEITNSPVNTSETRLTVFWCRATSRSMAAPVFNDAGNHLGVKAFLIRGCIATGDPWDVTAASSNDTPSTSFSITGLTTTVDNCMVMSITSEGTDIANTDEFDNWANASLTRFRELETCQGTSGLGGGFGIAVGRKATAGTVSATTGNFVTSSDAANLMIAWKPAATGPAPVTGTIAVTQANDTPAITGAENFTGTVAATQANQTSAISGAIANPITGAIAATQSDDTSQIAGELFTTADLIVTQADQTAAISGAIANPVSGSVAATQDDDSAAVSGSVTAPAVTGTIGITQEDDSGVFATTLTVTGSGAVTQQDDTAAISGSVAAPISGAVSATQDADTAALSGSLTISGSIGTTQDDDTSTIAGTVANPITGTLGATQAGDTGSISGTTVSDGVVSSIQDDQTASVIGAVANPVSGSISVTQEDDAGSFTGSVSAASITGSIAAAQDDQAGAFTAVLGISGTVGAIQDDDSFTGNGIAAFGVAGTITVTQDDDTGAFSGSVFNQITATVAASQDDQTMTAVGFTPITVSDVVSVTCVIGGPTLACALGGPTVTCTITSVATDLVMDGVG